MSDWEADMSRIIGLTEKKMAKVLRVVTMETTRDIIMDTPVLEGRLRGNWQVGIGSKNQNQLELTDKSGGTTISRITSALVHVKHTDTVIFFNNLPYAYPIEYGHSRVKAPRGMVRKNLVNWGGRVARVARAVKDET